MVESIPTAISGATMLAIIDRTRLFMEDFTGDTIGSTGIAEKYQPALINLSIANLLNSMMLIGADVNNVRLGDLSIGVGAGGNLQTASDAFRSEGMRQLEVMGTKFRFYKANG